MSHQGISNSYSDFKTSFYSRIGDGSAFNFGEINLLKVVLSGLKVNYITRGKFNHFFNKSPFFLLLFLSRQALKGIFRNQHFKARDYLIGVSSRVANISGTNVPLYFHRIFNTIGRDRFNLVVESFTENIAYDIDAGRLPIGFSFLNGKTKKFIVELHFWVNNLPNFLNDDEIENIKCEAFIFLNEYLRWSYYLKTVETKPSVFFLIHHYHHEGLILACKENGVTIVELQHGLIAKEDIFYVFPIQVQTVLKKALFPEKIFVYGQYWKEVLREGFEYEENNIEIIGFYPTEDSIDTPVMHFPDSRKTILITTQYSISDYYIEYVKKISAKISSDWAIVLKIHPAEKIEDYSILRDLPNVIVTDGSLSGLLKSSEFVVSIFSTTLFDALRYGKKAYCINYSKFSDYIEGLVKTGAIERLELDENPVLKFEAAIKNTAIDYNSFFCPYNEVKLKKYFDKKFT